MTDTAPPPPRPSSSARTTSRGLWVLVVLLLAPAVVLPLVVPLYDRTDPTLNGWPFYFWFQMALILLSGVLTVTAYVVSLRAARLEHDERKAVR